MFCHTHKERWWDTLVLESLVLREDIYNKWVVPRVDERNSLIGVLDGHEREDGSKDFAKPI